jgi:two-component system NtrC family response regulator
MDKPKLLIIDDDENIRTSMKWALTTDYRILSAADRPSALEVFQQEHPDLVTLDLGLPPCPNGVEEGFQTLADLIELQPGLKVIIITGQDDRENALNAIGKGAYDFLCKPIQVEELNVILRRVLRVAQLERDYHVLQAQVGGDSFAGMLGASPQMQAVFDTIKTVQDTDIPVVVLGESGTGKELVARAIHGGSTRRQGPFVAINCAAIPENLLESELFGHEKGAFTGAHMQRKGRIEAAHGGTLFLDEIGDLPLALQAKLLRFLQEHQLERVGGRAGISVDTRVIAATNADLHKAMKNKQFREDLYYRLGVMVISLPPLRDRVGDLLFLARAFLERFAAKNHKKVSGFTQQAIRAMESHGWPGNVRELENRIERAVIMAKTPKLTADNLQLSATAEKYQGMKLKEARESLEKELVLKALVKNKGNLTKVAAELGISRPTLYEMMEKLGLERQGN